MRPDEMRRNGKRREENDEKKRERREVERSKEKISAYKERLENAEIGLSDSDSVLGRHRNSAQLIRGDRIRRLKIS